MFTWYSSVFRSVGSILGALSCYLLLHRVCVWVFERRDLHSHTATCCGASTQTVHKSQPLACTNVESKRVIFQLPLQLSQQKRGVCVDCSTAIPPHIKIRVQLSALSHASSGALSAPCAAFDLVTGSAGVSPARPKQTGTQTYLMQPACDNLTFEQHGALWGTALTRSFVCFLSSHSAAKLDPVRAAGTHRWATDCRVGVAGERDFCDWSRFRQIAGQGFYK